jgi:hypothetical protein
MDADMHDVTLTLHLDRDVLQFLRRHAVAMAARSGRLVPRPRRSDRRACVADQGMI